jgi:amino acid transporter
VTSFRIRAGAVLSNKGLSNKGAGGTTTGRPRLAAQSRPAGQWALAGVAVTSLGGPLALAALYVPGVVAGASSSAGLEMVIAAVAFALPMWIWLDFARDVNSPGGLYAFTEAAAGRRVALVQAALWILSYALYLLYTTAQIVYDTLPAVLPGEQRYQGLLEIVIPVVLAGVMIAGRTVSLLVIGVIAAGQLVLAAIVGGVSVANMGIPASSFGASAPAGSLAIASGQTALLYICGSLPFFMGGEVTARQMRRGVLGAYAATVAVIIVAVAPLAAQPGYATAPIPGMEVAEQFVGHDLAVTVGIGVVVSVAGVMLVEYLALHRLLTAMTRWPSRAILVGIGVAMVAFSPVILINPDRIYDDLETPSLVALWLSQLVVFAVYPRFAARRGRRPALAWVLAAAGVALAGYGLWTAIQTSSL